MTTKSLSLFLLISLSAFISYTQAQDCNNPLLDTFNISGLSTPRSAASLDFCTDLRSGNTCCSNATVTGFQTTLDNLTEQLQQAAGSRDLFIVSLRDQYLKQFQAVESHISDNSDEIANLRTVNSTIGNEVDFQRDQLEDINDLIGDIDDNFRSAVQDYQQARVNCFETVLKVQASAFCLACDPNYASNGVQTDGTIAFSGDLCTAISQGCFNFLSTSSRLNPLFRARQAYQRLVDLLTFIDDFSVTGIMPNRTLEGDLLVSDNATERTVTIPGNGDCTGASNCPWQCQNLFSNFGVMNQETIANGAGVIGGNDVDLAPLSTGNSRRMLQNTTANVWNPNLDATGFSFDVVVDPVNVAPNLSGLRAGGMFVGLLVLVIGLIY